MDERKVEQIRRRHAAFIEQYSPGPDWEPCNQMSLDRGWLLAHIATLDTALAASRAELAKAQDKAMLPDEYEAEMYALREKVRTITQENDRLADALNQEHYEAEADRDALAASRADVAGLQAAVDGTHFHHKAFEPLCTHCRAAEAALTPPPVAPSGGAA